MKKTIWKRILCAVLVMLTACVLCTGAFAAKYTCIKSGCTREAAKGSAYCWIHKPTKSNSSVSGSGSRPSSSRRKDKPMRTGLTKQEKTTEIYFDEKDPTIFIRTHNTDLKNRLTAYSRKHPAVCKLTDVDPDTGCKEFEIEKGRFSFRLTAPYREERRSAASEAAKNE